MAEKANIPEGSAATNAAPVPPKKLAKAKKPAKPRPRKPAADYNYASGISTINNPALMAPPMMFMGAGMGMGCGVGGGGCGC